MMMDQPSLPETGGGDRSVAAIAMGPGGRSIDCRKKVATPKTASRERPQIFTNGWTTLKVQPSTAKPEPMPGRGVAPFGSKNDK